MTKFITAKSANVQMVFLGAVALLVGIICMIETAFIYKIGAITSISESATTGNMTGMILPFALGAMFTYTISYIGYCTSERIITRIMGAGFAIVAMQVCSSRFVTEGRVGLLAVSPCVSNIIHSVGALIGFGLMFVWIAFYFTRSGDSPKTKQKIIRNAIYRITSGVMLAGLILLAMNRFVDMGDYMVFIAEEFILIPAGIAVMIKGGLFLRDK